MRSFITALLLTICTCSLSGNYIERYNVIAEHGAITFTGNTLGLSKALDQNEPGTQDAIGAFITTNTTLQVGSFPPGTTLDYTKNNSAAILNIPAGSTILYAELIWSGSYGYDRPGVGEDPNLILIPANGPVNLTTPDGKIHEIMSDPATRQHAQNADPKINYSAGNYTRSQNVTDIVKAAGGGTYSVGHVPATISPLDNTHNAAGWTLAIAYKHPQKPLNNMTIFVGCEQAYSPGYPAIVSGFFTPTSGPLNGRLLASGIEGDANKSGDAMAFGPTPANLTHLSGPNNPVDKFFSSQINGDDGYLDQSGTFGDRNQSIGTNISAGRQGYDITNVDCTQTLFNGQTVAYAQGITNPGGEDYMINALAIQIHVESPLIEPIKKVNGKDSIDAVVGEVVNFEITMTNTGSVKAYDVFLKDELENALMPVSRSCTVNGVLIDSPDFEKGIPIPDLDVGETAVASFDVLVSDYPEDGLIYENIVSVDYVFKPLANPFARNLNVSHLLGDTQLQAFSNIVTIVLPLPFAPREFQGTLKKCKYLDKTLYKLHSEWLPSNIAGVEYYRIYLGTQVIGQVDANGPLVFETCLDSKNQATRLEVASVYPNFAESEHVKIQIH